MDTVQIYNVYDSDCPTRAALALIAAKWTALIIGLLEDGPCRFSALRRGIGGISQKMLTQTLRELERNGIVSRTIFPEVPPMSNMSLPHWTQPVQANSSGTELGGRTHP